MKLMIKRFFIITGLLLGLLIITGLIAGVFFEKEVKQTLVTFLNKQIKCKVSVKEIDLSIIASFPRASLVFYDVVIESDSPIENKHKKLLQAEKLQLKFSLSDLWNRNYHINELHLEKGKIDVFIDQHGNNNYNILKNEKVSEDKNAGFKLEKLVLTECVILYTDLQQNIAYTGYWNICNLNGEFWNENFRINMKMESEKNKFSYKNNLVVNNKDISLSLTADKRYNTFVLNDCDINVQSFKLNVNGKFENIKNQNKVNILVKGNNLDIVSFISLLPNEYSVKIADYESKGLFYLQARIDGIIGNGEVPQVIADFGIENGEINLPGNKVKAKNLYLKGILSNGMNRNLRSAYLKIIQLKGSIGQSPFEAQGRLDNFEDLFVDGRIQTELNLQEAASFFDLKQVENAKGNVNLKLSIFAPVENLKKGEISNQSTVKISAETEFKNVSFYIPDYDVKLDEVNGIIDAESDNINIQALSFIYKNSDIRLSGNLSNYQGLWAENEEAPVLWAYLSSKHFKLEDWIPDQSKNNENKGFIVSDKIRMKLNTQISSFEYEKFNARQVSSTIVFKNRQFTFDSLKFLTMGGSTRARGIVSITDGQGYSLKCEAKIERVNISSLFYDLNNFGQKTLTSEQIDGILKANVTYSSSWNNKHEVIEKSITANAEISIENGRIKNFKPLESLSRYVDLNELKDIKFSNLSNNISIYDRTLFIPEFEIQNSALNIWCTGKHTFDNEIDYHFRMLLNDVLGRKLRKNKRDDSEFGFIKEDEKGKTQVFISMTGTIDQPNFKLDKKAMGKSISAVIDSEKESIKKLFKEEFGKNTKEAEELNNQQKKTQNNFSIEWDEDAGLQKDVKSETKNGKSETEKPKGGREKSIKKAKKQENSDDYQ